MRIPLSPLTSVSQQRLSNLIFGTSKRASASTSLTSRRPFQTFLVRADTAKDFRICRYLDRLVSSRSRKHYFSNATKLCGASSKMTEAVGSPVTTGSETNGGGDRSKCVFCKIVDGKEDNEIYYQDDEIVVFKDIRPASTHHLLVVTREHIRDSKSLLPVHLGLLDRLIQVGNNVLLEQIQKQAPDTTNLDQIQKLLGFHWPPFHTVSHLHLHVIAPSDKMGFIARTMFRPNSFWFVTPEYVKERLEKMAAENKSNPNGNNAE